MFEVHVVVMHDTHIYMCVGVCACACVCVCVLCVWALLSEQKVLLMFAYKCKALLCMHV